MAKVIIFVGTVMGTAQGVAEAILAQAREASPARPGLPLDLGAHRVLVPSQFAARLIREELAKAEASVKSMCDKLLANTVIERYDIEIIE